MEFMKEEILKLLFDYSKNGKSAASMDFIDKLIDIVVNARNLENFLTNVKICKCENNVLAAYNVWDMNSYIDLNAIISSIDKINIHATPYEQLFFTNLVITQNILHELEHVFQCKLLSDTNSDSLDIKLIRLSLNEGLLFILELFKQIFEGRIFNVSDATEYINFCQIKKEKNYIFNPIERMAEINSYKIILDMIEPLKGSIFYIYQIEKELLLNARFLGYKEANVLGKCPTQVYLESVDQQRSWTQFDFYCADSEKLLAEVSKKYELTRRLELGLPITHSEYNEIGMRLNI